MCRQARLVGRAVQVAKLSEHRWRHGALLVKGRRIVKFSTNKFRCDPFIDPEGATWHAEEQVLKGLSLNETKGATIYVARVDKCDNWSLSRPCDNCMWLIQSAEIRDIVYTNELGSYSHERLQG